ncbi:hypothetical protein JTE90_012616 [Oedothorax gibbosus]|uniref:Uncharacterized protein n=1 Tax=Oedothorax gibbosus TaxID=931172 RepID=A0AAV6TJI4_9ARAC|nr:hypothetical protein JTE90_012614 [Oedothorax gibbosus]KAG8171768.1 hypothetical protein JTE90_012616 [Oedothorax gibbosus]
MFLFYIDVLSTDLDPTTQACHAASDFLDLPNSASAGKDINMANRLLVRASFQDEKYHSHYSGINTKDIKQAVCRASCFISALHLHDITQQFDTVAFMFFSLISQRLPTYENHSDIHELVHPITETIPSILGFYNVRHNFVPNVLLPIEFTDRSVSLQSSMSTLANLALANIKHTPVSLRLQK